MIGPGPCRPRRCRSPSSESCQCTDQLQNILNQLIDNPVFDNAVVTIYGSNNTQVYEGTLTSLDGSLLIMNINNIETFISTCHIQRVVLSSGYSFYTSDGKLRVKLIPEPCPRPHGCKAECERNIRSIFEVFDQDLKEIVTVHGDFSVLGSVSGVHYGVTFLQPLSSSIGDTRTLLVNADIVSVHELAVV